MKNLLIIVAAALFSWGVFLLANFAAVALWRALH